MSIETLIFFDCQTFERPVPSDEEVQKFIAGAMQIPSWQQAFGLGKELLLEPAELYRLTFDRREIMGLFSRELDLQRPAKAIAIALRGTNPMMRTQAPEEYSRIRESWVSVIDQLHQQASVLNQTQIVDYFERAKQIYLQACPEVQLRDESSPRRIS